MKHVLSWHSQSSGIFLKNHNYPSSIVTGFGAFFNHLIIFLLKYDPSTSNQFHLRLVKGGRGGGLEDWVSLFSISF